MDKPKKESALIGHKLEEKLCLNCGFPNRESDKHCMYCKISLLEVTGLFSWIRETYYIILWRRQLRLRNKNVLGISGKNLRLLILFGYLIVGLFLVVAGIYLFFNALSDNSFSSGLIAILFFFYGIASLKSILVKNN